MRIIILQAAAAVLSLALAVDARAQSATGITVEDIHGRPLNGRSITLVDWDGFLANPAIKLFVRAPVTVGFPATAVITSSQSRVYFNLPSQFTASGPSKSVSIANASTSVPFYVSIFPDRDGIDEDHSLTITIQNVTVTLNVHVIDQDLSIRSPFNVITDFTRDQTAFFSDAQKRALFQQAADDWAYFIDDMALDPVPVGGETTFIWNSDGFKTGSFTTNSQAYTGFLLYAYGISSSELRSGGEPASGSFQRSGGVLLPLRRSGGVEIETQGNYNVLGWFLTTTESDWWKGTNRNNEANDFYSIAHHEIGHALFFNPGYTQFVRGGTLSSAALLAYHGAALAINGSDHFDGSIDDSSLKGAFGYEYFGEVPRARWLPTKLDLLALSAVGYKIRNLSPFTKPVISGSINAQAWTQTAFRLPMQASGGVPAYDWTIETGVLPPGLTLDRYSGVISGLATLPGTFSFTVRVRDSDLRSGTELAQGTIVVSQGKAPGKRRSTRS